MWLRTPEGNLINTNNIVKIYKETSPRFNDSSSIIAILPNGKEKNIFRGKEKERDKYFLELKNKLLKK